MGDDARGVRPQGFRQFGGAWCRRCAKLGQGLLAQQRGRETLRIDRRPPSPGRKTARRQRPDPFDHARRDRAGSTPARTSDDLPQPLRPEPAGTPGPFRLPLEPIDHLADGLGAAEEDRLVFEVEVVQAPERRTVRPCRDERGVIPREMPGSRGAPRSACGGGAQRAPRNSSARSNG